ncbi:MAG: ABC transporter ATP-binding protein, partial [Myxococcota bacterium]|nr:ABC transporter ATP-binding protein [Myxococcota bacterium]
MRLSRARFDPPPVSGPLARAREVLELSARALQLVWTTSARLTVALGVLTLFGGLLPAGAAWVGQQIVDGVIEAAETGLAVDRHAALAWVAVEGAIVVALAGVRRAIVVCNTLLRARLGNAVNVLILRKALELQLTDFEDSETYDQMTRARREASRRPLSLVQRTMGLIQNGLSIATYGAILIAFSPLAVLGLAIASVPAFVAETRFAGEAHSLFSWRSPDVRRRNYLEVLVAREDHAKEVKLLGIGPALVDRYDSIFRDIFAAERGLILRRGGWGLVLGALSTAALYCAYGWMAATAVAGAITLGQMTMYLLVFKQGQTAFGAMLQSIGGIYEDSLYMRDLYAFLGMEVGRAAGRAITGSDPGDGVRFDAVSFTYPGAERPAVENISLHIPPGTRLALVGHNGSGKTTLIKLLTGLYQPSSGRVMLDGRDLQEWD